MLRDLHNNLTVRRVISPVAAADTTPLVGQIIDHQGYDTAEYLILTGSLPDADATFTVLLEEGDAANLSDAAAVADADLLGTEAQAGFQFGDDNQVRKLGYKGTKQYTRLTITPANLAAGAELVGACVVLGRSGQLPVASQADA